MFPHRLKSWVPRIYLGAGAVAAVATAVTGHLGVLWTAVLWYPPDPEDTRAFADAPTAAAVAVGLLAILALKTWMLGQVFAFPTGAGRPTDRRVVRLRRLLYLAVAYNLVVGLPARLFPEVLPEVLAEVLAGALEVALMSPLMVLFALVLARGRAATITLALAQAGSVGLVLAVLGEIGLPVPDLLVLGFLAGWAGWQVAVLFGQHRDGRWSRATVTAGWLHIIAMLTAVLAGMGAGLAFDSSASPMLVILGELDVFYTVWLARSAHELTVGGPARRPATSAGPTPFRPPRPILLGAALLPLLLLVHPEQAPTAQGVAGWVLESPRFEAAVPAGGERPGHRDSVAETGPRCGDPWPGVRARRQGTSAYFLFEGGGYGVYDPEDDSGEGAFDPALDDRFVGAAGGSVYVSTYGELEAMCLTVKAFASRPPLRLRGWEDVAEVGVVSRSGRLEVPRMTDGAEEGAAAALPDLAVAGPGRYRVRVHARVTRHGEEHLVVVFPGRSARKVVYRDSAS